MVHHVFFVLGIVCTVCVIIVLQVLDVLVKRARSGSRTILLYCIMFFWRYLLIKLPGVLVLAPRRCEAHRCFIDRRCIISGSEKTFRRDRMLCTLLWWETYGNQRSRECRYNKGFRHGGTSREAIYYDVTAA